MLRIVAIILSATLLMQSFHITFNDLVQLDELMEHARYHKQQFGDDFASFLSKHYGEEKEHHSQQHQEEKEQHEQLPFQQMFHMNCAMTILVKNFYPGLELPGEIGEGNHLFYYLTSAYSAFQTGIFQPPRLA